MKKVHQEDTTVINTYASNNKIPKHMKEKLTEIKEEKDKSVIIETSVSHFSIMGRASRHKINKEIEGMDDPVITRPNRRLQNTTNHRMYTLLKYTWDIPQDKPHVGRRTSLNKYKRIEIIPSMFFNHNVTELEINIRKNLGKLTKMWKLNRTLLTLRLKKNQWEIKKKTLR